MKDGADRACSSSNVCMRQNAFASFAISFNPTTCGRLFDGRSELRKVVEIVVEFVNHFIQQRRSNVHILNFHASLISNVPRQH